MHVQHKKMYRNGFSLKQAALSYIHTYSNITISDNYIFFFVVFILPFRVFYVKHALRRPWVIISALQKKIKINKQKTELNGP